MVCGKVKKDRVRRKSMDWTQVLTVFAVIATNLGTIIALYMQLDRKIDENRKETNQIVESIRLDMKQFQEEMKYFHGRICSIEERNKGKS